MKLEVSLMFAWAMIHHTSTTALMDISASDNKVQSPSFHPVSIAVQQPPYPASSSSSGNRDNKRNGSEKKNGKSKDGRVPRGKAATLGPTTSNQTSDATIAPTVVSSSQSYKYKGEKGKKGLMSYKNSKSPNPSLPTQDPTESKHSHIHASKSEKGKSGDKHSLIHASKSKKGKSGDKNVFAGMKSKTSKTLSKGKGYPNEDEDDDKILAPTQEPTTLVTTTPQQRHYYAMKHYPNMKYSMSSSHRSTKYLVKKQMDSDKGMSSAKKLTKSQIISTRSPSKRRSWPSIDERHTQAPTFASSIHSRTLAPSIEDGQAKVPISLNNFTSSPTDVVTSTPTKAPGTLTPVNATEGPSETMTLTPSLAPVTLPLNNSTQAPTTTPTNSTLAPATALSNLPQSPTQNPTIVPINTTTTLAPSTLPINSFTSAPIISVNATQSPTIPSTREPLIIPINATQSPAIVPAPTNTTQEPSNPNNTSTLAPITLNSKTIDFEGCAQDLLAADLDNNDAINISEYLRFVQEYGKRKCMSITVADELTLEQNSTFNLLACMCRFEAGVDPEDSSCCVAQNASIKITREATPSDPLQNRTQEQVDLLITICSLTDASIDYQCDVDAPINT